MSDDIRAADALIQLINEQVQEALKNSVRTCVPGYVSEFDPATQFATLQVGIKAVDIYGESFELPPILNCPMCIYGGSGGSVDVKISEGDEVLIHFSHRCIVGWRETGGIAENPNPRRFSYSDAFAQLSPSSRQNALTGYTTDGIRIRSKDGSKFVWVKDSGEILADNGSCSVKLSPGGEAVMENSSGHMKVLASGIVDINGATIDTSGNVTSPAIVQGATVSATSSLTVAGVEMSGHTHSGSPTAPDGPVSNTGGPA